MRRVVFKTLAILCGVLAVTCLVLQVTTFWKGHVVAVRITDSLLVGALGEYGSVGVGVDWSQAFPGDQRLYYETSPPVPVQRKRFAGFIWHIDDGYAVIGIPGALAAVGFGFAAFWLWRRQRRTISGICHACGYDLRASPERCPECGTAVAPINTPAPALPAGTR